MIIVVLPSEEPEERAAAAAQAARERLAAFVEDRVPFGHVLEQRVEKRLEFLSGRALCGDHGRVVATSQGLCPQCAGSVMQPDELSRYRTAVRRAEAAGLYDRRAVDARRAATFIRRRRVA